MTGFSSRNSGGNYSNMKEVFIAIMQSFLRTCSMTIWLYMNHFICIYVGIMKRFSRILSADLVRVLTSGSIRGLVANPIRGLAANPIRGLVADQVRVLAADRVRGLYVNPVRGLVEALRCGRGSCSGMAMMSVIVLLAALLVPAGVVHAVDVVGDGDDGDASEDNGDTSEDNTNTTESNVDASFGVRDYSFTLASESNGSVTPVAVGEVSAVDPDNGYLEYSLRVSDPAGRIYMVGGTAAALYALDSATGMTVRVGRVAEFGVSESDPRGLAWHNGLLYMVGGSANSLYTLDMNTGEAALVAAAAQLTGSRLPLQLGGVASHDGDLYVTTSGVGRLYRVDLDAMKSVKVSADDFGVVNETSPTAIASHGNPTQLYMTGDDTDALYMLDTTTGETVRVGSGDGGAAHVGVGAGFGVSRDESCRAGFPQRRFVYDRR